MLAGFAHVGIDIGCGAHSERHRAHSLIDVVAVFAEVLELQRGLVEEVNFHAIVLHGGRLPSDVGVGITVDGVTVVSHVEVLSPCIPSVAVVGIYIGKVVKALAGRHDIVVTHESVTAFELEHREDFGEHGVFPERLVGYDVSQSDGGEEAPPVVAVELFRAIIAKVGLEEISFAITVCESS